MLISPSIKVVGLWNDSLMRWRCFDIGNDITAGPVCELSIVEHDPIIIELTLTSIEMTRASRSWPAS